MAWPEPTDYNEAIQNPQVCFGDDELRQGQLVTSALGLPVVCAGNFALVYQVHGSANQSWAVKCFTRAAPARQQRYQAISEHLRRAALPFTVDFRYLEEGIRVGGRWFPAVKMRWVEGLTLNALLREHVDRPQVLQRLCQMWLPLAQKLRGAGIAHADLQHGNVMLVPGQKAATLDLRLIDYDGMFVPALAHVPSGEVGHPAYQHPQRLRDGTCNAEIDRFAHLVVYTALRCLLVGGRPLWERHDNTENLLFREQDFKEPGSSQLFEELLRLDADDAVALVGHLLLASQDPLDRVPSLEQLVDGGQVMPLTPREQKRVRELLPAGTQAGPVPVELVPALEPGAVPVAIVPEEEADSQQVIPLVPLAPEAPAPRRSGLKRPEPVRKSAAERARLAPAAPPRPRWLLAGACAGGGLLGCVLLVVVVVALLGSGDSPPSVGPGEGPGPGPLPKQQQQLGRSLKLGPIAAVALKAGERLAIPIRLQGQGVDGPVTVSVEGLPERVWQEQMPAVGPGQTDAVIPLRAELGAPEGQRELRVVARGKNLEAVQSVQLTVARQTAVRLPPLAAVRLKSGTFAAVPLRLSAAGHDVPLDIVLEGLPDTVRRVGNPVPLRPGQNDATFTLTTVLNAPPGAYKGRVCVRAGGAKLAEQALEVHVEQAGSLNVLPIATVSLKAGETRALGVTVQRQGCEGDIRLEVPPVAGVRVDPVTMPANVRGLAVYVTADKDAVGPVNLTLVARLGSLQDVRPFKVIVEAPLKRGRPASRKVVFLSVDEVELHGTFYPGAQGTRKAPCVLLLHAFGEDSQKPGGVSLAQELQQAGFAVLGFDFRGHGASTAIHPEVFWKQRANQTGVRGFAVGKRKATIAFKEFIPTYRLVLANDVAAAKAFLDARSLEGECDASNVTLIGAGEGATVGALWLNAEWHRYRALTKIIRPGVMPPLAPKAEGRHVTAVVWLGIQPTLGSLTVSIPGLLDVAVRQHGLPVAFVHGADDVKGKGLANRCQAALAKKKSALVGVKAVPGPAVGSALLEGSPDTVRWIADCVRETAKRGDGEGIQREWQDTFIWRFPRTPTLPTTARGPGERVPRFDTYQQFLR